MNINSYDAFSEQQSDSVACVTYRHIPRGTDYDNATTYKAYFNDLEKAKAFETKYSMPPEMAICVELKQFRIYWLHGKTEIVTGEDIANAFTNAGYGAGATRAIDFYGNGPEMKYHRVGKEWVKNVPVLNVDITEEDLNGHTSING